MKIIKNSLDLFVYTTIAFFSGLTDILYLEIASYSILLFALIKSSGKYWKSSEGIFVILFSLITIPFIVDQPIIFYNHFKQLILTLSIIVCSINFKPLSTRFLSIISIINFIIVFLQLRFNFVLFPSIFFRGNYISDELLDSMFESPGRVRPVGILVGSHPSTFLICLASLSLYYANKESFNLLFKGILTKKNLLLTFIFSINFIALYYSFTITALVSLFFQFCIIFGNKLSFFKFFRNIFNKIYIKSIGLKINIFLICIVLIFTIILLNIDKLEGTILDISKLVLDNRGVASFGIITAQLKSFFTILNNLPLFPSEGFVFETNLGNDVQRIFGLSEFTEMGLETGYFKILFRHGFVIGSYLLFFLFRKLYGIRTFMFFSFIHYAHITTNPLILIMAITASKYSRCNSKEKVEK